MRTRAILGALALVVPATAGAFTIKAMPGTIWDQKIGHEYITIISMRHVGVGEPKKNQVTKKIADCGFCDQYDTKSWDIWSMLMGNRWADLNGWVVSTDGTCFGATAQDSKWVQYAHFLRRDDDLDAAGVKSAAQGASDFIFKWLRYAVQAQAGKPLWFRDGGGTVQSYKAAEPWFLLGIAAHALQDSFSDEHTVRKTMPPPTADKAPTNAGFAGVWREGSDAHSLQVGLDWKRFTAELARATKGGLRLVDFDTFVDRGTRKWTGVWRAGTGGEYFFAGLDWKAFNNKLADLMKKGYLLSRVKTYLEGSTRKWAGAWHSVRGAQYFFAGLDWKAFEKKWRELGSKKVALVDLETYVEDGKRKFAGVWKSGSGKTALLAGLTWSAFQAEDAKLAKQGLRLVDLETYLDRGDKRYAGVWGGGSGEHEVGQLVAWSLFQKSFQERSKKNLRLVRVARTNSCYVAGEACCDGQCMGGLACTNGVCGAERLPASIITDVKTFTETPSAQRHACIDRPGERGKFGKTKAMKTIAHGDYAFKGKHARAEEFKDSAQQAANATVDLIKTFFAARGPNWTKQGALQRLPKEWDKFKAKWLTVEAAPVKYTGPMLGKCGPPADVEAQKARCLKRTGRNPLEPNYPPFNW